MRDRFRDHTGAQYDRGASAMLVASSLLVLLGFAALAVDGGILFDDRRQQASASDVGALAAVQFAKTTLATTNCGALSGKPRAACRGAEEAMAVVEGTLPGRYALADWQACTDPDKPAEFTRGSTISPCINFTGNLQKARVVLPETDVDTAFGRVIGLDSVPVGTFAEAGMDLDLSGGVLPFAVGPAASGSNQACFFAQSTANLDIDPCTASVEGNFGKLNLRLYGNTTMGTPTICSGGNAQRMSTNIVLGSDHPLRPFNTDPLEDPFPDTAVNDNTNCAIITNPVNELDTWTGNAGGALADGLINGISTPSTEGRLMCKNGTDSPQSFVSISAGGASPACVTVNNVHPQPMDHTPLWAFIKPGANSEVVGGVCAPGGGPIKNRAEMEACLAGWRAWPFVHTTSLFTDALNTSPRFGAVPRLDKNPGGGFGSYLITDFQPVYIETLYFKCNANSCDIVHSPGESSTGACPTPLTPANSSCGWSANGNKGIEAVTSFMLTMDMLPPSIADNFPFTEGTIVFNLTR